MDDQAAPICSARGCRQPAAFALRWNNPRLHPPHRRKSWLACAEHREHLSEFLDRRGFLREVTEVGEVSEPPAGLGPGPA